MEGVLTISVTPESALLDEEQNISVRCLRKHQEITIQVRLSVGGGQYASSGCFRSDDNGVVDISNDPSLKGTYTGVDKMGLLWSMEAEPGYERIQFKTRDVKVPLLYDIYIYDGILSLDEVQNCQKACLATSRIQRLCMEKSVRLEEIRDGPMTGKLFIPKGE
ncbi:hypothetical protein FSP39_018954 [Pinctada imbricata]|uniref:Acyl-CoA thioester hydrolase/bile acid-CoA amino acid N-acetyltransferase domain-containing protein n=1 Tax=Pinctada imbricata TaxID=66713 RepID=A0AA88YDN3_PINIB|nr:hypothetical protein FSP39_018954 [Pinctada imbricata]